MLIGVMVLVLLAAYYVTKYIAKRGRRLTRTKCMKVIDQMYLSTDKQIALVKVGKKNLMIGITNQSINHITTLDDGDIVLNEQDDEVKPLGGMFDKVGGFIKNAKDADQKLREYRNNNSFNKKKTNQNNDLDNMMYAVNNRKSRYEDSNTREDRR
jgi:flagellar protein FliO/FliZ